MKFESLGRSGLLDDAFKLVEFELPPELSVEDRSRLAVEVYKAWLNAEALGEIESAISRLAMSLEENTLSRNNGK